MRLILLTEKAFFGLLAAPLQAAAPRLDIVLATTPQELEAAIAVPQARILSVGSGVVVPAALLARLAGPAYNLHPGPPEYPGLFPSVFALYDGAKHFGVTLHEMAAAVDSGTIVAVERFDVPPSWDRLALDTATFDILRGMLARLAPQLANVTLPLPRSATNWSGPVRRRKDFEALCQLPEGTTQAEFERRYRAIGEGPDHALTMTRFGRTFRLDSGKGSVAVRAGVPLT